MKRINNFLSSILYFMAGLCMTLIVVFTIFQFGKSIYAAVQFYQVRNEFLQVSAEVTAIEAYVPAYCEYDKDYKVTMSYEFKENQYQSVYDYKNMPEESMGDWVVLQIDPRDPALTKVELQDRMLAGFLILLLAFGCFELWRCKKKSSYCYVTPFTPQQISNYLIKINQRDLHRAFRCIMAMIFAGTLIWINDSEKISWFLAAVGCLICVAVWILFIRILRKDILNNDEYQLYFDSCLEKRTENYEDSACHYLMLEETEKVFSVSDKVYHKVRIGDDICLVYLGKNKKKPYLMCLEKR